MKQYQRGFNIVELMVALSLSSLMLLGVLQIFDSNKQTGNLTNTYARVQENGRMAIEILVRDIRMAGSWGCAAINSDKILNHLDTDDGNFKPYMDFTGAPGVEGQDDVDAGTTVDATPVKEGSDMLTLRGTAPVGNARILSPYMTPSSATIHINNGADIPLGTLLMISDCNGADLFSNTASDTTSGELNHDTVPIAAEGAVPNEIKNLSHTYGANGQISTPFTKIYFVGQNDAGGWSLFQQNNGQTVELVNNVNDLQIMYGEDTGGDGSLDKYSDADDVTDMSNVVSIQASFDMQSENMGANGDPLNRTYTVTANVRNRSL